MTAKQIKEQIAQKREVIRELCFLDRDTTIQMGQLEEEIDALYKELYRLDEEENIFK